jgi:hypothetical protein
LRERLANLVGAFEATEIGALARTGARDEESHVCGLRLARAGGAHGGNRRRRGDANAMRLVHCEFSLAMVVGRGSRVARGRLTSAARRFIPGRDGLSWCAANGSKQARSAAELGNRLGDARRAPPFGGKPCRLASTMRRDGTGA